MTFSVEGKRQSRVRAKPGRTVFVLLIKPMQQTMASERSASTGATTASQLERAPALPAGDEEGRGGGHGFIFALAAAEMD